MMLVELSQAKFEPPQDFDALDYITQSIANLPRPYPFEVFLKADPGAVEEEVLSIASRMEPLEDGVLLMGSTDNWIGWHANWPGCRSISACEDQRACALRCTVWRKRWPSEESKQPAFIRR